LNNIIVIFDLKTRNVCYLKGLKNKKYKSFGKISAMDFSPSAEKLIVGFEKGYLAYFDVIVKEEKK